MYNELIDTVDAEVSNWPCVRREVRGSAWGGVIIYWIGKRQIGHIHDDGVADLQFPRAVHDRLIAEGRAEAHRGGFAAVVSYSMQERGDELGAIELFRLSYDRAIAREHAGSRPTSALGIQSEDGGRSECGASAA